MGLRFWQFFILLCVSFFSAYSDKKDSVDVPKRVYFFKQDQFNTGDTSFLKPDTTLDQFQIYTNRYTLGNNGLPSIIMTPPVTGELGFNYSPNNLERYSFSANSLNYYNTTAPCTRLIYVLGAKKEQDLKVIHSQNVNRNLNFTAGFNRIRSDGFYQRENTNHNNFFLSSNYLSPGKRYALLSNTIINSIKYAENGGIASDTSFENGSVLNKSLIAINLSDAQRKIRERSFYLKQFINLGPRHEEKVNDSVTVIKVAPRSSLSHSMLIQDTYNEYVDNERKGSKFYNDFYNDTTKTKDSLYYWKFSNELLWEKIKQQDTSGNMRLAGNIGLRHELIRISQYVYRNDTIRNNLFDTSLSDMVLKGRLYNYGSKQKFLFDTYVKYVLKGYNEKGYDLGLTLRQLINSSNYFQLQGVIKYHVPDLFYQHYESNHFRWNNSFNNTTTQWGDLKFVSKKLFLEAGGSFSQYRNFVYLDQVIIPRQFGQTFKIVSAYVNKDFHVKNFTFANRIIYQKALDSTVVRIPEFITYQSLYFTLDLFKKALHTNIGVDVFFNTSYFSNAYMPATGQFYLQSAKETGNYPYFDFFFSMKIKTARIFLKYEHLNSGLMGNTYYAAPGFPMPERAFKFGISWSVFN